MKKITIQLKTKGRAHHLIFKNLYHSKFKALKELIDNAFDSGATIVNIMYDHNKRIIIVEDNGCGIPSKDLEEAMALGVEDLNGNVVRIGYFGIGAKSSIVSISTEKTLVNITTKTKSEITKIIDWRPYYDKKSMDGNCDDNPSHQTGTRIEISYTEPLYDDRTGFDMVKSENYGKSQQDINERKITNFLGLLYQDEFAKNPNLTFTYNNNEIKRHDPIYRDSPTTILIDEEFQSSIPGVKIPLKLALISRYEPNRHVFWDGKFKTKNANWPQSNQGLYPLANSRYISTGKGYCDQTIIMHGDRQTIRIEPIIPTELYEAFGVDIGKQQFNLSGDTLLRNRVDNIVKLFNRLYKRITVLTLNDYLKNPEIDIKEYNDKWCMFFKNMSEIEISTYLIQNKEASIVDENRDLKNLNKLKNNKNQNMVMITRQTFEKNMASILNDDYYEIYDRLEDEEKKLVDNVIFSQMKIKHKGNLSEGAKILIEHLSLKTSNIIYVD